VIDADAPGIRPVTVGCVAGVVAPAAMETLAGDTVTLVLSLLARLTVTPPVGAAADRVTVRFVGVPRFTEAAGTPIDTWVTFTVAVALVRGDALAVMVAEPAATAVTVTVAVVAPAAKFTVAGTVALVGSLETRLTVKPPVGAWPPVIVNVRVPVGVDGIVSDSGDVVRAIVGIVTVTAPVPDV
jgi:hypothetical protein